MIAGLASAGDRAGRRRDVRARQRVGHALARLFVEVEAARSEGQVEIDDGRVDLELVGDAPADIVRERRGADAAAAADERDTIRPMGAASGLR